MCAKLLSCHRKCTRASHRTNSFFFYSILTFSLSSIIYAIFLFKLDDTQNPFVIEIYNLLVLPRWRASHPLRACRSNFSQYLFFSDPSFVPTNILYLTILA